MAPTRSATVRARIEPDLKRDGDAILDQIGLSQSDFLTLAYKQLVLRKGLPFAATVPDPQFTEEEMERRRKAALEAIDAIRATRTWAVSHGENSTDFIRRMRQAADGRPLDVLEGRKIDRS